MASSYVNARPESPTDTSCVRTVNNVLWCLVRTCYPGDWDSIFFRNVCLYQPTRRHILKESYLHSYRCENLKYLQLLLLLQLYRKSACFDLTRFTFSKTDFSLGDFSLHTVGSVSIFCYQRFCPNVLCSSVRVRIFYFIHRSAVFSFFSCLHS